MIIPEIDQTESIFHQFRIIAAYATFYVLAM